MKKSSKKKVGKKIDWKSLLGSQGYFKKGSIFVLLKNLRPHAFGDLSNECPIFTFVKYDDSNVYVSTHPFLAISKVLKKHVKVL